MLDNQITVVRRRYGEILLGSHVGYGRPGELGAKHRNRGTSRCTQSMAKSTSAAVLNRPRLNRSELRASESLSPSARNT